MQHTKNQWKLLIEAIPNWQTKNKQAIADLLETTDCTIHNVIKTMGMPWKGGERRAKYQRQRENGIQRRGVSQARKDLLDKKIKQATDYRCDKCALLKRQCWECYSFEVAGRLPIEPCVHSIEPRGVFV